MVYFLSGRNIPAEVSATDLCHDFFMRPLPG